MRIQETRVNREHGSSIELDSIRCHQAGFLHFHVYQCIIGFANADDHSIPRWCSVMVKDDDRIQDFKKLSVVIMVQRRPFCERRGFFNTAAVLLAVICLGMSV